jgi:hypothetical protein
MSLKPAETLMFGCVLGNEECCAIRDSWRPNLPVRVLSASEFDVLVSEDIVFVGRLADLAEAK